MNKWQELENFIDTKMHSLMHSEDIRDCAEWNAFHRMQMKMNELDRPQQEVKIPDEQMHEIQCGSRLNPDQEQM
jgi:hypothetical protein